MKALKAVGAIAIAYPAMITESVIGASGIIFGALLLLFALTGIIVVFALVPGLLDNKKFPATLVALAAGIISGFALDGFNSGAFSIGLTPMNVIFPSLQDFWTAFIMLILPQIPLTISNACVGTADTCTTLFPQSPLLSKSTAGRFALTMGIANFPAGFFGAVPMCH